MRNYKRTYILLPPGASAEWAHTVIDATWDEHRYTLGGSADDAGIGANLLEYSRVITVNPDAWPGNLFQFFNSNYPGTRITPIFAKSPQQLAEQLNRKHTPPPGPPPIQFPKKGLHDLEGGKWMAANGIEGWCCVAVYVEDQPIVIDELTDLKNAGIRVILNLRYSWATDDGGQGTMPVDGAKLGRFEEAVIATIYDNDAWGFVYCNEMNNPREWPRGEQIVPGDYYDSYLSVWDQLDGTGKRLSPGVIDPYNAGWDDWRPIFRGWMDDQCYDFVAIHAYTHGPDPALVRSLEKFGDEPLVGVFRELRVVQSYLDSIPAHYPVIVTETNHLFTKGEFESGAERGWVNDNAWIKEAASFFDSYAQIDGWCAFRYNYDDWEMAGKDKVMKAFKEI